MSRRAYSPRAGARGWLARLVWMLVLSFLAGCSALQPTLVPPYELAPTATPPAAGADPAAITRIRARGMLRVGIRFDLAPFGFVTEDGELFWGNDRLEAALAWARKTRAVATAQQRSRMMN